MGKPREKRWMVALPLEMKERVQREVAENKKVKTGPRTAMAVVISALEDRYADDTKKERAEEKRLTEDRDIPKAGQNLLDEVDDLLGGIE